MGLLLVNDDDRNKMLSYRCQEVDITFPRNLTMNRLKSDAV